MTKLEILTFQIQDYWSDFYSSQVSVVQVQLTPFVVDLDSSPCI